MWSKTCWLYLKYIWRIFKIYFFHPPRQEERAKLRVRVTFKLLTIDKTFNRERHFIHISAFHSHFSISFTFQHFIHISAFHSHFSISFTFQHFIRFPSFGVCQTRRRVCHWLQYGNHEAGMVQPEQARDPLLWHVSNGSWSTSTSSSSLGLLPAWIIE